MLKEYIVTIVLVIVLIIFIYVVDYNNTKVKQEKENRINRIETRLEQQMNYIHDLEADVDNLKEVLSR